MALNNREKLGIALTAVLLMAILSVLFISVYAGGSERNRLKGIEIEEVRTTASDADSVAREKYKSRIKKRERENNEEKRGKKGKKSTTKKSKKEIKRGLRVGTARDFLRDTVR